MREETGTNVQHVCAFDQCMHNSVFSFFHLVHSPKTLFNGVEVGTEVVFGPEGGIFLSHHGIALLQLAWVVVSDTIARHVDVARWLWRRLGGMIAMHLPNHAHQALDWCRAYLDGRRCVYVCACV